MRKQIAVLLTALVCVASSVWSYTVSGTTYTTNGSQSDVQAACSAAPDNGTVTVVIPNGTYRWSGGLSITHSLTLAGASATGAVIQNANATSPMISVVSSTKGHTNIYWLNVVQVVNNGGSSGTGQLSIDRNEPSNYTVLVHDCTFDTASYFSYAIWVWAHGVIFWNNNFPATGAGATCLTGISFTCSKYGQTSSWNTPSTFGTADTTGLSNSYVEDCSFTNGSSFACDVNDNGRVVWRHNIMQDSMIGNHGQETSPYGARHYEIYDNTFKLSTNNPKNVNNWIIFRGGSAVFCNNVVPDIPSKTAIMLTIQSINRRVAIPCQTAYPAARQTGQGWSASSQAPSGNPVVNANGIGATTEGIYIWNNTGGGSQSVGLSQFTPDECGNGQRIGDYLKEGRDYFVGTAKPNYTPYQYPHPLHVQFALGGGPAPSPTPPQPTPSPTAPQPTPTPPPLPLGAYTFFDPSLSGSTADPHDNSVELGMKFTVNTPGTVTALRFYKNAIDTGSHTGTLWTAGGTKLVSVIFSGETASGWQQQSVPEPVQITAGTEYVVSYHSPGHYSHNPTYFDSASTSNGPFTVPGAGANGVFTYGTTPVFPTEVFNNSNYWADVVFSPSGAPSPTPSPPQPTPTPQPTPPQQSFSDWLNALSDWVRHHPAVPNQ